MGKLALWTRRADDGFRQGHAVQCNNGSTNRRLTRSAGPASSVLLAADARRADVLSQSRCSFRLRQLRHEIVHDALGPQCGHGTEVDMPSGLRVGQTGEPSARQCGTFADRDNDRRPDRSMAARTMVFHSRRVTRPGSLAEGG
jgi:hypothetical protein